MLGMLHLDDPIRPFDERTPAEVDEACREAADAFLRDVATAPDDEVKRCLAAWLVGPYRAATTGFADRETSPNLLRVPTSADAPTDFDVRIARVVSRARHGVWRTLRAHDADLRLAAWGRATGAVVASDHPGGEVGVVPVDLPRMALEDRVMSLFAVAAIRRIARGDVEPPRPESEEAWNRVPPSSGTYARAKTRRPARMHAGG